LRSQDARPAAVPSALLKRVGAAAAVGALITAAGWGVLSYLSAGVTAREERLRRTVGVLEPELQRRDDERRRAAVAAAREAALPAFASQGPRLARIMETFSAAAPADVALTAIRVEPGDASWRLIVEGQAEGADAGAAYATFGSFLNALDASPVLGRPLAPPVLRARTSDPADAVEAAPSEAPPPEAPRAVRAVEPARPASSGPAYIEVARDGRLYRIPLKRRTGNLEADRRAEEARRLQEEATARQAAASPAPAGLSTAGAPGRQSPSVVEFTLRYEVP
jgi:hypothetical protein